MMTTITIFTALADQTPEQLPTTGPIERSIDVAIWGTVLLLSISLFVLGISWAWRRMRGDLSDYRPPARVHACPAPTAQRKSPLEVNELPEVPVRDLRDEFDTAVAAVESLDRAWLDYVTDPEDYFLTRPLLHESDHPDVKAYRAKHSRARDLIDRHAAATKLKARHVDAVTAAVAEAWLAWDQASSRALKIGLGALTPAQKAAARRCTHLVALIGNETTSDPERESAISQLRAQLDVFTDARTALGDLADMPALASIADRLALPTR